MTSCLPTIQALTDEHGVTTHVVKFGKAMFVFESVALADQIKAELDAAVDEVVSDVLHAHAKALRAFVGEPRLGQGAGKGLGFAAAQALALAHLKGWRAG